MVCSPKIGPGNGEQVQRFVRSIEVGYLNKMIFFGERSLRKATREYAAHYHRERNHQGIDNRLIASNLRRPPSSAPSASAESWPPKRVGRCVFD